MKLSDRTPIEHLEHWRWEKREEERDRAEAEQEAKAKESMTAIAICEYVNILWDIAEKLEKK